MNKLLRKAVLLSTTAVFVFTLLIFGLIVYAGSTDNMVTATINYYYYDEGLSDHKGSRPFPAFVANMPKGSPDITEKCPTVPGFTPVSADKKPLPTVTVGFGSDSTEDVFYIPSEVPYVIRLYKQNLDNNGYTLAHILNRTGITGTEPAEFESDYVVSELGKTLENAFEGYTLMYHVPEVIAADGSTEFECYYDRNYYLVNFDLGSGGYGVEPIYAPYEHPLSVNTPKRAGYNFKGWEPELADKVTENIKYTAKWEEKEQVKYTIIYKNADISDGSGNTSYSYWGTKVLYAAPDTQLSIDDIMTDHQENTELTDYQYFTFDRDKTKADNDDTVTVKGDGSTIIKLYYSRNQYKLRFIYARYIADTQRTISKAAQITSGKYYIINKRSNKMVTPNPSSSNSNYLATLDFSEGLDNVWTVEEDGSGGYYIKSADGKYLTLTDEKAMVSNTPVSSYIGQFPSAADQWTIMQSYNGNHYLNNKSDSRVYVGPSAPTTAADDAGNACWFYPAADDGSVEYKDVTDISRIGLASGTANGNLDRFRWYSNIPSIPQLKSSCHMTTGTVDKVIGGTTYTMPYVELVAEYGADIEEFWPSDILEPVGEYRFGSWSTEYGSGYRARNSTHANILGEYPYMSAEMIVDSKNVYNPDDTESVAQNLYAWWGRTGDNISEHRYKIYYEVLPDETGDIEIDGIWYKLDRTLNFVAAHNRTTRTDPFEYKGFTILESEKNGYESSNTPSTYQYQNTEDGVWTTEYHYRRNKHKLTYYNYNTIYDTGTDTAALIYGLSLSGYDPGTPPYPNDLHEGAYEFAGWYDSDTYDEKFDWDTTMPDRDVVVYAYWKPKTYTIRYYNDESEYHNNHPYISKSSDDYGTYIDTFEAENKLNAPIITTSTGTYNAAKAGWYYYDSNGMLHAFDPATMTVTGNMDLFMKWSSTVPTTFTVHYYKKGTTDEVATDTTGYSFVGLTRTFKAKVDNELNNGYKTNYFPDRSSTSILMQSDNEENVKTFYYVYRDKVPYRVRYVVLDGENAGKELHEEKVVEDNIYSVVSEKYVPIDGYVPVSYYISLTLTVSDDPNEDAKNNVITFYYTKDHVNMPYHIKYMIEDDSGKEAVLINGNTVKFKEMNYIDGIGAKNSMKEIQLNSYSGYEVNAYKVITYVNDERTDGDLEEISNQSDHISIFLDSVFDSKEVHIYYLKKDYPVKVVYKISDGGSQKIAEWNKTLLTYDSELIGEGETIEYNGEMYYKQFYRIQSDQKYNTIFSETAPALGGFRISGSNKKSVIVSEDDDSFTKNKIEFVYTAVQDIMFYYKAVIPDGSSIKVADPNNPKLLSINQEISEIGVRPKNTVIAVTETDLYHFIGWYTDEDCTQQVVNADILSGEKSNELKPQGSNVDVTYYAKYDYKRGDLVLNVTDSDDENQCFEFVINGKDENNKWLELKVCIQGNNQKTIKDLPVGNYEITQTDWSWRYKGTPDKNSVTVTETESQSIIFTEHMFNHKWLDGNAYKDNNFKKGTV